MRLAKRCVACDGERLRHAPKIFDKFIGGPLARIMQRFDGYDEADGAIA
jgi:hypothetical protein